MEAAPLPHGACVGLASQAVRVEEDRELTFEVRDGATRSRMATGVRDDDGGTVGGTEVRRQGRQQGWHHSVVLREVIEALRKAVSMARCRRRRRRRGQETWAA
jgi:hypothetical protein